MSIIDGTNNSGIKTKAYLAAVGVLLRISKAMFDRGINPESYRDPEDLALDHWYTLRLVVATWMRNSSTELTTDMREKLHGALRFAHEVFHEAGAHGPIQRIETCECDRARQLRELALLQIADATGVEIPGVAA